MKKLLAILKEIENVKKLLAILLVLIHIPYFALAEEIPERNVTLNYVRLLSRGYTTYQAEELIDKWNRGEPLTPFEIPDYDTYNSPAEENGRYGDLLLITGTIKEYVKTGNASEYVVGVRIEQDDGSEWMISCALYYKKNLVGGVWGVKDKTVFDGLENNVVEIYGKYTGFSEKFKLPAVDIATYGGMYVAKEDLFISTMTAKLNMRNDNIWALDYLVGAKRYEESTEKYMP